MSTFTLSRATPLDLPEIVRVQYASFTSPFERELLMGCTSPSDLPKLSNAYIEHTKTDPTDIWVKVTDTSTGEILGASNWNLYVGPASSMPRIRDEAPFWLEGEKLLASKAIFGGMNDVRIAENPMPFLHLHICFTHPDHQRRGIGALMMKWGCELADRLCLPGWIEASPNGTFLYKKFGFYECQEIVHEGVVSGVCMRRDAKQLQYL